MRPRSLLYSASISLLFVIIATSDEKLLSQETMHRVPDATNPDASRGINKNDDSSPQPNQRAHGSVLLSDGNPQTQLVEINAVCPTFRRLMAIVDSKGKFSFSFEQNRLFDINLTQGCMLEPSLAGYRSQRVSLANLGTKSGRSLGQIVLQPIATDFTGLVSAADGQASPGQKKACQKSLDKASRQDWKAARAILQEIISAYPGYSSAWLNLGIIQQIEGDPATAEKSYLEAARVDPRFAIPLIRAAALEISSGNYPASLVHSQSAIDLNPKAFPDAYSLNASANLSLQHAESAEKSARAGLALDTAHHYPELEYVLGAVLYGKNDREIAREHLQEYIQLSPNGPNTIAAKSQLIQMRRAEDAVTRLTASADDRNAGPSKLVLTTKPLASIRSLQDANAPLLTTPAAYTCLESILASKTNVGGQRFEADTTRVDIAVFDGKEIYGPADGKHFSNGTQKDLLGYSFSTTGLFSSIAHSVIVGNKLAIEFAGEFALDGESVLRYNFYSLPGAADWTISYGSATGSAAEEGWFLVDKKSLVLRRVFVRAANIPNKIGLIFLSALIGYESETLAGHRVLLPSAAKVKVGERSGVKRVSLMSFDHCRAFTAESTVSFAGPSLGSDTKQTIRPPRLPLGVEIVVALTSPVSLAIATDNDVLTATVVQPVLQKGRELIARGATIEGHVRAEHGHNAVVIQLDRVQTKLGWVPFYAHLLFLRSTDDVTIRDVSIRNSQSPAYPYSSASAASDYADISEVDVPGVAAITFRNKSTELIKGTQMVWRTEPLDARKDTSVPHVNTSMDLN